MIKALMVCLGLEPGAAEGWHVQTNPLCYSSTATHDSLTNYLFNENHCCCGLQNNEQLCHLYCLFVGTCPMKGFLKL